jgi:hypothetical protein
MGCCEWIRGLLNGLLRSSLLLRDVQKLSRQQAAAMPHRTGTAAAAVVVVVVLRVLLRENLLPGYKP